MDDWTNEQLAPAVEAYRWMQVRTAEGSKLSKTQLYRDLALKQGRSPGAWDTGCRASRMYYTSSRKTGLAA